MDDDNSFQQRVLDNSKMAELFMECEEEELEPWQRKVEEPQVEDDDDDELIFVGEISSSKPAISNILNRSNTSSTSKGMKSEPLGPGISNIFKPTSEPYGYPTSDPMASFTRFHPGSKPSQSSTIVHSMSKSDSSKDLSQIESDNSPLSLFDSAQDTMPLSTGLPNFFLQDQTSFGLKRPTSKISSVNPKKPKTSGNISEIGLSSTLSSEASCQVMVSPGSNISSAEQKTEEFALKPCPKCDIQLNNLELLKFHMKRCCPDMLHNFLGTVKTELSSAEGTTNTVSEKQKLIMLVSDFYYGKHDGTLEEEPKTYTTFKCFSCSKVLKNNIRFMNHMKHHLELEKQNSESWENHTTCQHCYRQYPTPFQLQCHIESTHTPHEFSTICKICELSFETEHILLQHMKDTHKPGEMPYICQVCQFRSSTFSDVETHFRASHENTKNLLCPFCLKVSRMATPYMNHYMKHQKKGIHRCSKCRLQFLTSKEKTDHKAQHRTFIKPKELEGLPPGTKITIRASLGPPQPKPPGTPSSSAPSSSSLQVLPPESKNTTAKNLMKSKTTKPQAIVSCAYTPNISKPSEDTTKYKAKALYKEKRQRNRKSKLNMALTNLRCLRGNYKCIECRTKIKDFENHFVELSNCNFCKYSTNCNKAFVNHLASYHGTQPNKQCSLKKQPGPFRGLTLVCLKCDFVIDSSSVDFMAKHLSQRKTHTCQVIIENVSESTSTSEPTSLTAC